ncbi:MAG: hypothetical protein WCW27_01595 [Patescibacteria group bacterium]|jgi:uridine kinase
MITLTKIEERYHIPLRKLLFNKWFLIILGIKIIAGSLLGSDFLVKGFIPFVNYFVTSGFHNPYEFFVQQGYPGAFPYPPVMLWIFTLARLLFIPFVNLDGSVVQFGNLLMMRLPILLADTAIYIVLAKWLETKEKQVLWLYWTSPILFFINYVHGQLDVMPMAILFISLIFLFNKKPLPAVLLLGLGIATKTHLLVVLPFYFIYFFVNRYSLKHAFGYCCAGLAAFGLIITPYLFSNGFIKSVFGTDESAKIFLVSLPYLHNNLQLLLAVTAIFILFFNFFPYHKLNKDAFLLILGLLFTVFVIFVPPMPGWFYWSIPFYVYFFAKYQNIPKISFWSLNIAYLLYFVLSPDAAFTSSFQLINSGFVLAIPGLNIPLLLNLIFTLLVASIIMNAVWIYRVGVKSNLEYKIADKPLVVGIGGDSGAGKNTLAKKLVQLFGNNNAICIEGDDAHKWERNNTNWQQFTHLNPKSNNLYKELLQTAILKTGANIKRSSYNHATGKFTSLNNITTNKVIIYVGLHPFYLSKMRSIFDIKIYVEPDEALRKHWKLMRDQKDRQRSKEEILKQLGAREADANQYIRPQRAFADVVISLTPTQPLQEGIEPVLVLDISCDNSIQLDPLIEQLANYPTIKVEHWYEPNLHHQTIRFAGILGKQDIRNVAYVLIPNLEELTYGSPVWDDNYNGIEQLFVLYFYSELNKLPE